MERACSFSSSRTGGGLLAGKIRAFATNRFIYNKDERVIMAVEAWGQV